VNKPRHSILYLLSVDRALRKISLKRVRRGESSAASRSRASRRKTRGASKGARAAITRRWILGLAVVLIAAASVLIAARRASYHVDLETDSDQQEPQQAELTPTPSVKALSVPVAEKTRTGEASKNNVVVSGAPMKATDATTSPKKPAKALAATTLPSTPVTETAEVRVPHPKEASSPKPAAAIETSTDSDGALPVTIAGCLERDRQTFWLKNASGPGVQRVRNWKSGFFKKRASAIALVDPGDALGLQTYIGQRVSATGTIIDGEMRARSLQQISDSCN